jgi:hypothetical protein
MPGTRRKFGQLFGRTFRWRFGMIWSDDLMNVGSNVLADFAAIILNSGITSLS